MEAIRILYGANISENFNVDEEFKKLENSIKNVQDFNKNFANELYSEAYFDKEFIKNPSSNIMSLRLGREKRKIDEEKNNKK